MQRLLKTLPSSALRMAQVSSVLARPSSRILSLPLRTTLSLPSTTRFSSSSEYLARNTPEEILDPSATPEGRWTEKSKEALDPINPPPNDSYAGRSVPNTSGKNLLVSLKKLDSILARNRVRSELRRAERHEKKGEKRRRLQSQRWRNRFANEVRQKVQLVNKIRMRGA